MNPPGHIKKHKLQIQVKPGCGRIDRNTLRVNTDRALAVMESAGVYPGVPSWCARCAVVSEPKGNAYGGAGFRFDPSKDHSSQDAKSRVLREEGEKGGNKRKEDCLREDDEYRTVEC